MRQIRLESLKRQPFIDRAVIVSITNSLYSLRVYIGQSEYLVLDHGATVRRSSAEQVKNLLRGCKVGEFSIFHRSAYDEMIGLPDGGYNILEVSTAGPHGDVEPGH
jgi:hypothetical protein